MPVPRLASLCTAHNHLGILAFPQFTTQEADPQIKITYDLSPMSIVLEEQSTPLYHFITSVCAIIGGIFTIIGCFDSAVYTALKLRQKLRLGKQG